MPGFDLPCLREPTLKRILYDASLKPNTLKAQPLQIEQLVTERLIVIPFTIPICKDILANDFSRLHQMGLHKGKSWPDEDVMETLPRIINNLSKVDSPTGFESWMIVKRDTREIIGDLGFKGFNAEEGNADIGYGIIEEERKKGYALEAATALLKWAFSNEFVKEITARCAPGNEASIQVLRKLGFIELKTDQEMIHWSVRRN